LKKKSPKYLNVLREALSEN